MHYECGLAYRQSDRLRSLQFLLDDQLQMRAGRLASSGTRFAWDVTSWTWSRLESAPSTRFHGSKSGTCRTVAYTRAGDRKFCSDCRLAPDTLLAVGTSRSTT